MVEFDHVHQVADTCLAFLTEHLAADWRAPIPDIDGSVIEIVGHAAEGCLWYAVDLAAAGADVDAIELRVEVDGDPAGVVEALRAHSRVIAAVVETQPHDVRGFHPMGMADPSGFAAMACDEMLIHTDDAARGLDVSFDPPHELAEPVLRRLFPWVSEVTDPWQQLRWANGRIELDGRPRLTDWAWHCAPLDEWDGTMPRRPARPDAFD